MAYHVFVLQVWAEFKHLHGQQLESQDKISEKLLISKAKASIRQRIIQSFSAYVRSDTAQPLLTKGYVNQDGAALVGGTPAEAAAGEAKGKRFKRQGSVDSAAAAAAAAASVPAGPIDALLPAPGDMSNVGPYNLLSGAEVAASRQE
jgi:hypothetical protein